MRSSNWSIWLVCGLFLAVLAFLAITVRPARGDDFSSKVSQLQAKTAAKRAKKTDPFTPDNKAVADRQYSWVVVPGRDECSLWSDGKQVGGYRFSTGEYYPLVNGAWGRCCKPPVAPPQAVTTSGACVGGCQAACNCPGTAGGSCNCAAQATPQPVQQAPRFFVVGGRSAAACQSGH